MCGNGRPYTYSRTDYFQVHVLNAETEREVNCVIEPRGSLVGRSLITISFTVRVSGEYTVLLMINGQMLDRIHRQQYQAGEEIKREERERCIVISMFKLINVIAIVSSVNHFIINLS